jgi:hypothetical protein
MATNISFMYVERGVDEIKTHGDGKLWSGWFFSHDSLTQRIDTGH